jgi:hypothetical protein
MGDESPRQADGHPKTLSSDRHSGVVTLLFTDVVGSTALKQRLGDRAGVELKGVTEPIEICEVRAGEAGILSPPTTSEKARRLEAAEGEAVLGWRFRTMAPGWPRNGRVVVWDWSAGRPISVIKPLE